MFSPNSNAKPRPEVLAPVASMEMAQAAVQNGANAIYVGFPGFNARGRTPDLDPTAYAELAQLCRFHGVKVYVALNVLVFEDELASLLDTARTLIALGIDAFIVQDLGVARLLRRLHPGVRLHASTQMTVTAPEAVALTEDLHLARYVLARELSLQDIEAVRLGTDKELEVFVHGALCVSYSGQCLTSESFGGRSANRGQCAQSCRLDYDLLVDGEKRDLGEKRYLVSPQDLCGLDEVPALAELGVNSLKIEGRLKTPAYVAAASKAYQEAVQRAMPAKSEDGIPTVDALSAKEARRDLAVTYSRGFFSGWLHGVDHQALVPATFSHHRGLALGPVLRREGDAVLVAGPRRPQRGDGVLFVATEGMPSDDGVAGRVYEVEFAREGNWLRFDRNLPVTRIEAGWVAYLNDSPALEHDLTASWRDRETQTRVPVIAAVQAIPGEPLRLTLDDGLRQVTVTGEEPLLPARNAPLDAGQLNEELERMQGEGFQLESLDAHIAGPVFLHGKALRKLRQAAVAELKAARSLAAPVALAEDAAVLSWMEEQAAELRSSASLPAYASEPAPTAAPRLHVLLREIAQVEALTRLAESGVHTVYLDFEYGRDYKPALEALRGAGIRAALATTRIMKPLEKHNLTVIEKLRPDAVLVRNLAALQALRATGLPLIGDFSLNAANSLTSGYLLGKGLHRLTPSYDLNQAQLLDLIGAAGGRHFEVTVHQFLPAFHMEHCVFAAFLSQGHSFRDCGKPCERHRLALRDHTGAEHPVKADQECRNTMFHGQPQSSARLVPQLLAAGVRDYRVELLWEGPAEMVRTLGLYRDLLTSARPAAEVYAELRVGERYGVSEGQLHQTSVWKDRKKK